MDEAGFTPHLYLWSKELVDPSNVGQSKVKATVVLQCKQNIGNNAVTNPLWMRARKS